MKFEPRFPLRAYDYFILTNQATGRPPYPVFQVTDEPVHFYDYLNYYVPADSEWTVTLNGHNVTVGTITLHVPNLGTQPDELIQARLGIDSLDLAVQVTINGKQLFQLGADQTYLTPLESAVEDGEGPWIWSYGTDFIPELTITNTNPYVTLAATGINQGIQVWGYKYSYRQVSPSEAAQVYASKAFTTITTFFTLSSGGGS